jgi:hypothetical protein
MTTQPRGRRLFITRAALKRLLALGVLLAAALALGYWIMIRMPGRSHVGPLPPLDASGLALRDALARDVEALAGRIGPRSTRLPQALAAAADHLERELAGAGYAPRRQWFEADGVRCCNLEAELAGRGRPEEIVIVGAHYDSVADGGVPCPGANDNATGVAATLALARRFAAAPQPRTLRFVLFTNEEPPHFQGPAMGSLVYARRCRERGERIVAMVSLETIGCYLDAPGSQQYPAPFGLAYPSAGNFIAFVGNVGSRALVRRAIATFRGAARFPSEGGALPGWVPGVGWSDHWAFWQEGYPAIMVTDTAPFRSPHYHRTTDTPDRIDYPRMTLVVQGMEHVVRDLADAP